MAEGKEDGVDEDLSFGRTLIQFFVVPAFVVAICVGVFFFFAWLVSDEKSSVDYLNEIRAGSASRRWQAAFELSKIITLDSERSRMEGLVPEMIDAFEKAEGDDPRVRHYLALSLGNLGDETATPVLIEALSDEDATTRLYASWALGNIGDRSAVGPLIARVSDDDAGARKMAVYALGAIGDEAAIPRLEVALSDPDRDVSWNAAIALAQLDDPSGEAQLLEMLDREFLAGIDHMDDAQRLLTMESAIKAAGRLGGQRLTERLRSIGDSDPHVGIRKAAIDALEGQKKPTP
ncbi:MAG TPA: HEAT repeat domain-containing protein [Vicinamibacteria bacterium]|nr:HEAT repeat domain-containing protein [Vicinamibacteria bacterium]